MDKYGTRHDTETERIELDQKIAHEEGRCRGAPICSECLDEQENKKEEQE